MNAYRALSPVLLACVLATGVAACGSSSPSPGASPKPATPTPAASSSSSATAVIAANWTTFFNAKTPVAQRVSLLQDGPAFAPVIKAQAGSGLASQATAKVTKVTLVSATQAKVTYSILVSGQAALSHQTGVAVYSGGTWKVGIASFCGLLALENGGKTSSLPAACKTAG